MVFACWGNLGVSLAFVLVSTGWDESPVSPRWESKGESWGDWAFGFSAEMAAVESKDDSLERDGSPEKDGSSRVSGSWQAWRRLRDGHRHHHDAGQVTPSLTSKPVTLQWLKQQTILNS